MSVLPFDYSVQLRCVLASKLALYSFLSMVCCEGIREVLFAAVQSKALYMKIGFLFDFVLELMEVREQFTFLAHGINPGVLGEVVDERYIISITTKCCRLGWSPYI